MSQVIEENSGGVVLDPFSGSGSTAVAARNLGHSFIGFEIDRGYWEISVDRLRRTEKTGVW